MNLQQVEQTVAELAPRIAGSRVSKIHQPAADLLILRLWNGHENLKLLLSVSAQENQIGLTEQSFPNPFTPPRFCQLLRARLSRIVKVVQLNEDRIVEFTCQGPKGDCRLIVELFGKGGELILLDAEGKVIDSLKRQPGGRLTSKTTYQFPEKQLNKDPAAEVSLASKSDNAPLIVGSVNDLEERLRKLLKRERKKLDRRLRNISQEQARQQDFEQLKLHGELLLANLHLLKKGMNEVVVVNYYQQPPEELTITLDPLRTPQGNAEKYFQKYKKARRGLEHSARRLEETTQEIEWLEQLVYQLDSAQQPGEITEVAAELKEAGLLKDKISKLPRTQKAGNLHRELLSPNGFKVLWGTNSRQNDILSSKIMKRGDLWFHAHRCPGSHVVLRQDREIGDFADADLVFAASIAAANSKGKMDSKVEVMVAQAQEVRKPSGAKPGLVTVACYKTLVVQPFADKTDNF